MHTGGREDPGSGRAVLAGIEVPRCRNPLRGGSGVGVRKDDDRSLAAELEVNPFEGGRSGGATSMPARTEPVTDTMAGVS